MKYYKYKNYNKIYKEADNQFLASLDAYEKKKVKKSRRLGKLFSICGAITFILIFVTLIKLITLIPVPKNGFLLTLYGIGIVIFGLLSLAISIITPVIIFGSLFQKIEYNPVKMRKEFLSKACADVRRYYRLYDDYIITKCFNCTNDIFNNHDICIYRVGNEIRITADIVNGFINDNCDLGCYSVKFSELKIYKDDYNTKRVTVLEFNDIKFIIGIRAYSFITKLLNVKIYKYLTSRVELSNDSIYFVKRKDVFRIKYKEIDTLEFEIPRYIGIPGSGLNYDYSFKIIDKSKCKHCFSIVLERDEEKEIIEILKKEEINLVLKYYDNVPRDGCGD